jgi:hypothetical protein
LRKVQPQRTLGDASAFESELFPSNILLAEQLPDLLGGTIVFQVCGSYFGGKY